MGDKKNTIYSFRLQFYSSFIVLQEIGVDKECINI